MQVEPRVINGPELLNQFIGNTEDAICELFTPAIVDEDRVSGDLT
jgi:hypothetical protein